MQDAMKLVFTGGDHPPLLLDLGQYRIGSHEDADVRLSGDGIQAEHAELQVGTGGTSLRIPAGHPVDVNGRRVDGLIALRTGDEVAIGGVQARLVALKAAGDGPAGSRDVAEDMAATAVRPVVPRYVLRGVNGGAFARSHPLHAILAVGRAENAGLRIDDEGISRQHARLTPADDGVMVEDLGSANGTFLNGRRIVREVARHGDEIAFDGERYRLIVPGQPDPVAVAAHDQRASSGRVAWILALLVMAAVAAFALTR